MTAYGKFQGEPNWVEAAWEACLDGEYVLDTGHHYVWEHGGVWYVLHEDSQGFVTAYRQDSEDAAYETAERWEDEYYPAEDGPECLSY